MEKETMKPVNFTLSDESWIAIKTIPRAISASAIIRWVLLALVLPEKELIKRRNASPEGKAVADYLRGKIEKLIK
jgi:hypothetical protein